VPARTRGGAPGRKRKRAKPATGSVLEHMRAICLALPDTKETLTWGEPHFRVGEKIFAGCGDEQGKPVIGFKLEREHAEAIVQDPRFWRAPYVGHKGWVSMDASAVRDWRDVRPLILESYRLIAPARSVAKLVAAAVALPAAAAGRFADEVVQAIHKSQVLGVKAGSRPHRVIGIWAVVVEGRVFVRSWSVKPNGWNRSFVAEPRGVMEIAGREFPVRAARVRSERLQDGIDRAYLAKYCTKASLRYVRDLRSPKSRATTLELRPLPGR
jgi:predicted DNA-binding protein (MmcQ/YjbR family)